MSQDVEARLAALEARQRAYRMHDPDCMAFSPFEHSPIPNPLASVFRPFCECWLAGPETLCDGCGHAWKTHTGGHCFRDAKSLGDDRYQLACPCVRVAV